MSSNPVTLEVCVDNVVSLHNAIAGGADRIELCASLMEDGLTPSLGFLQYAKSITSIPIFVMVRPRGGNFVYSAEEVTIMTLDIHALKEHADGFVWGCLTADGDIDMASCLIIAASCAEKPTTFHRAIDVTNNPVEAAKKVSSLPSVTRILTSGGHPTALEGVQVIKAMQAEVNEVSPVVKIMPGGGVTAANITEIVATTGVSECHGSFRGPMKVTDKNQIQLAKEMLTK